MAVRERRVFLAQLRVEGSELGLIPSAGPSPVTLDGYSRFKHGDGRCSAVFGRALAAVLIEQLDPDRPVLVTSSGYDRVPPAAHSLVQPVLTALREAGAAAQTLHIHRAGITDGDYATMPLEARQQALSAARLSLRPEQDLTGAQVVALDDVLVTGVHEAAAQQCLERSGARDIIHAYLVDARSSREDPHAEAALNTAGAADVGTLVQIAVSPSFIPNARFCKRILLLPDPIQAQVLEQLPGWVLRWMEQAVAADGYALVPAYAEGARRFAGRAAARQQLTGSC